MFDDAIDTARRRRGWGIHDNDTSITSAVNYNCNPNPEVDLSAGKLNPLLVEFQKAFPAFVKTFAIIGMDKATAIQGKLVIPSEKYWNIEVSQHKTNEKTLFIDVASLNSSNTFHIDDNKSIEEQIFDLFELIVSTIIHPKIAKREGWVEAFYIIHKVSKCGHELTIEGDKISLDETWHISSSSGYSGRIFITDGEIDFSITHNHYLDPAKCLSEFLDMIKTWDGEFDCDYNLEFDEESVQNENNNTEDEESFPGERLWKTS